MGVGERETREGWKWEEGEFAQAGFPGRLPPSAGRAYLTMPL